MVSESVLDGDYPITGIQTTTKITEQMIQESYGAAVEWIRNADVPTHLTDEQLQVFLRKLAELCGKAEQADAIAADDDHGLGFGGYPGSGISELEPNG